MIEFLEKMAEQFDTDNNDRQAGAVRDFLNNVKIVSAFCGANGGGPPGMETAMMAWIFRFGVAVVITLKG